MGLCGLTEKNGLWQSGHGAPGPKVGELRKRTRVPSGAYPPKNPGQGMSFQFTEVREAKWFREKLLGASLSSHRKSTMVL